MKLYFCGSIRGGRDLADLYGQMIGFLKPYGQVLTEHVGDPALTDKGGDGGSDYIWKRDTDWLKECDLVIAECTQPSLGVGYELAYAEALSKPVHVFYGKADGRLSAMVAGCPNMAVHLYETEAQLFDQLREVMEKASG